ncbi:MAG: hypothetical protein PHU88_03975, partial [candidate division Zixibacteria bacterium]|nr:hypothetical protein [candidate division Zixibacteria bacterium]
MQSKTKLRALCLAAGLVLTFIALTELFAQSSTIPRRSDIDHRYKWDLSHIYPDWTTWEADLVKLEKQMNDYAALK